MCSNCAGDYQNPDETAELVLAEPEPPLSQVERLEYPKCAMLDGAERVEQLCKSVSASYFHVHVCQQIHNHIGEGDALDVLLHDIFYRRKFGLAARVL